MDENEVPQFALAHSDEMSSDTFSKYMILLAPAQEGALAQTVALLPVNKETLDINIINNWGNYMPIGVQATVETNEEDEKEINPDSIRAAVVPRILILLSMVITGYNFLDYEAQKLFEFEQMMNLSDEELPEAPKFDFESPEDLFKAIGD